jgi:hypothetical protein
VQPDSRIDPPRFFEVLAMQCDLRWHTELLPVTRPITSTHARTLAVTVKVISNQT